jgi:hypothetical protein
MPLPKDLREFIESLNSRRVEYLIVGAHALAWYGVPRYTGDLGVLIRTSPDEAWGGRVSGDLHGVPVNFIGKESFIKNKRATGRTRDKADLEALGVEVN